MESRAFIRHATDLIAKIKVGLPINSTPDEDLAVMGGIQKEINQLFAGLQNPTLPSAYRLRDIAIENGFHVDQRVMQRLAQFEFVS